MNIIKKLFSWGPVYERLFFIILFLLYLSYFIQRYTTNGSIIFITRLIYWIGIPALIVFAFAIINSLKLKNAYVKGGVLYDWYDFTFKHKGTLWIKNAFDKLLEQNLINANNKLVVVSPSANKGTYEKALFEYISGKNISSKFIITDLYLIDNHEESFSNDFGQYLYLYEENNAKNINDILKKAGEEKANVIMDFQGCLWYTKETLSHKKLSCMNEIVEVLSIYNNSLNSGGLIMVDNKKGNLMERYVREWNYFTKHFKLGAGYHSTGSYLLKLYNTQPKFKNYIDENFDTHIIDVQTEYKKVESLLVYAKK